MESAIGSDHMYSVDPFHMNVSITILLCMYPVFLPQNHTDSSLDLIIFISFNCFNMEHKVILFQ